MEKQKRTNETNELPPQAKGNLTMQRTNVFCQEREREKKHIVIFSVNYLPMATLIAKTQQVPHSVAFQRTTRTS